MSGFMKLSLAAAMLLGAEAAKIVAAEPPAGNLRSNVKIVNATVPVANLQKTSAAPCQCVTADPSWVAPTRTQTRCLFIDLGAANGNTLQSFLNNGYGPVANCPNGGEWHAVLVEANPRFMPELTAVQQQYGAKVQNLGAHAAYDCEGQTSFYLDTVTAEHNYWGSSMSGNAPDVKNSGLQKVTVPTLNVNKLLFENTIPGDYAIVKMDIEGAEWDVVPCMAQSPSAKLMDALYVEVHDVSLGLTGTTQQGFDQAKASLQAQGVNIPNYWTPTTL
mmetsp:Transcript_20803/g.46094  ORF Transcript_20803/g.46094 Transcript_20803/m.46094 type:complete len:275 (+) Transcript_20803:61-885(+)